jgi:uncharacterized protein (DUF952 family)
LLCCAWSAARDLSIGAAFALPTMSPGGAVQDQEAVHLVAEEWYRGQQANPVYLPEGFDDDGFIHLTHGTEAVMAVGNAFYRGDPRPYLLLTIDLGRAGAEVCYDDASRRYPHLYGPLEWEAITAVQRVVRGADGSFHGVEPVAGYHAATETGR